MRVVPAQSMQFRWCLYRNLLFAVQQLFSRYLISKGQFQIRSGTRLASLVEKIIRVCDATSFFVSVFSIQQKKMRYIKKSC